MKKLFIPLTLIIMVFSSCSPIHYYQLFEAKPIGNIPIENQVVFEDENCRVVYDLWDRRGDMGFTIYNKTDSYLSLDLSKSFLVINGAVYDYFLNRTYTTSSASGLSATAATSTPYSWSTGVVATSGSSSSGASSSIIEKFNRTLPPKTHTRISQFSVTKELFFDCDFVVYPEKGKISSVSFDESNTPYEFYNLLNYSLEDSAENSAPIEMKNTFYIHKISNYPEEMFFDYQKEDECGNTLYSPKRYFKFAQPNSFYLGYRRAK